MGEDIVKQSNLKVASFVPANGLTKGQNEILQLLAKKIQSNEIVSREDICQLYIDSSGREGKIKGYDYDQQKSVWKEVSKSSWWVQVKAMQWFKMNLGSCIIKGKLLVIPVIEID